MIKYVLPSPKLINPDVLASELGYSNPMNGHGVIVFSNDQGLAVEVAILTEYTIGMVPFEETLSISLTEEQVISAIASHSA